MAQVNLNGVDIQKIEALVKDMQDNPKTYQDMANSAWNARAQWVGGFQHSVYARQLAPTTFDEPTDIAGGDKGLSPHEAVMGCVAACVATGFVAQASVRRVKVESLEVQADGKLNLPVFFGLAEGNPGYDEMTITVYAQTDATPDQLQEIYDKAVGLSPVLNTIQRPVKVNTVLRSTS
jgi:uncharacterized OsmC-like protein